MIKKVAVLGSILVDTIKMIDFYPSKGMLCKVKSMSKCVGGCVPNTAIDLARLGGIDVNAFGYVGRDADGEYVVGRLKSEGVDVSGIKILDEQLTSFTDVMTLESSGERTFFSSPGANALFDLGDFFEGIKDCGIAHVGYLLLLDKMDATDVEYGTVMARRLHELQKMGVKTSIDVVSESGDRFSKIVTPALKYCNYAVVNEIEAGMVAGIPMRDVSGGLIKENIQKILEYFIKCGVEKAIIHCPEAGFSLSRENVSEGKSFIFVPSLELPEGYIKGTVGAGDAFCAGILYSLCNGFSDERALEFASCSSAMNLSATDSIEGATDYKTTDALKNMYKRKENVC